MLLSERDVDSWWTSASATIFEVTAGPPGPDGEGFRRMTDAMLDAFDHDWRDEEAAKAAYLAHNDEVRAKVAPDRLIVWHRATAGARCAPAWGWPSRTNRSPT